MAKTVAPLAAPACTAPAMHEFTSLCRQLGRPEWSACTAQVKRYGHDSLPQHGAGASLRKADVERLYRKLVSLRLLVEETHRSDAYQTVMSVIKVRGVGWGVFEWVWAQAACLPACLLASHPHSNCPTAAVLASICAAVLSCTWGRVLHVRACN
jgi:hypothetical protein